jgi:hypothetical protein
MEIASMYGCSHVGQTEEFDKIRYDEEVKKQKAVGALLKAKDKIDDGLFILSTAMHSNILDSKNPNIVTVLSSLQTAKTCIDKELSDLWGQKENASSSVLGHP